MKAYQRNRFDTAVINPFLDYLYHSFVFVIVTTVQLIETKQNVLYKSLYIDQKQILNSHVIFLLLHKASFKEGI